MMYKQNQISTSRVFGMLAQVGKLSQDNKDWQQCVEMVRQGVLAIANDYSTEQVHGYWTTELLNPFAEWGEEEIVLYNCSLCGAQAREPIKGELNYCSHCGAKMEEVQDG